MAPRTTTRRKRCAEKKEEPLDELLLQAADKKRRAVTVTVALELCKNKLNALLEAGQEDAPEEVVFAILDELMPAVRDWNGVATKKLKREGPANEISERYPELCGSKEFNAAEALAVKDAAELGEEDEISPEVREVADRLTVLRERYPEQFKEIASSSLGEMYEGLSELDSETLGVYQSLVEDWTKGPISSMTEAMKERAGEDPELDTILAAVIFCNDGHDDDHAVDVVLRSTKEAMFSYSLIGGSHVGFITDSRLADVVRETLSEWREE
jgi:hypothetical protein